jgi:hypothetical protein
MSEAERMFDAGVTMTFKLSEAPIIEPPTWGRLRAAGPALWRLADRGGRLLGHVRADRAAGEWRFRAERFSPASGAFRVVGEFWRASEAFECLRYQG